MLLPNSSRGWRGLQRTRFWVRLLPVAYELFSLRLSPRTVPRFLVPGFPSSPAQQIPSLIVSCLYPDCLEGSLPITDGWHALTERLD